MGGSSGDSTTVQKADPWSGQQPYLRDVFSTAQNMFQSGMPGSAANISTGASGADGTNYWPQYFGGDTVSDLNPTQQSGIQGQIDWANQFQQMMQPMQNANNQLMSGGNQGSQNFAGGISSSVLPSLTNVLSQAPSSQIGNQQLNLSQFMPNGVNTNPITADPNSAINSMLSGQVNTQGLGQAINAANQPIMDNFNENIMPSIRGGEILTGQLGGSRGDLASGLAASRLNRDMMNNANTMGYQAYQDAQNRQSQGAQLATNAQLSQSGMGLQGYGLAGQLAGQQANLNLSADQARAGDMNTQIGNLLSGGGLANSALSNVDSNTFRGLSLAPGTLGASQLGFQNMQQAGNTLQGQSQQELDANIARWDYNQQLPMNMLDWYSGLVQGNNLGGSTVTDSQAPQRNKTTGALGGAATGASVGSSFGPYGAAIGAGAGGLLGYFA